MHKLLTEHPNNVIAANIQVLQQFATLSMQIMQRGFELQLKTYEVYLTGQGLSRAAAEWQELIQHSAQRTIELLTRAQTDMRQAIAAQATPLNEMAERSAEDLTHAVEQTVANA